MQNSAPEPKRKRLSLITPKQMDLLFATGLINITSHPWLRLQAVYWLGMRLWLLLVLLVTPLLQHPSELPDQMTGKDLIAQENYEFGLEKNLVDKMDRVDRRDLREEIISFTTNRNYRAGYDLIWK